MMTAQDARLAIPSTNGGQPLELWFNTRAQMLIEREHPDEERLQAFIERMGTMSWKLSDWVFLVWCGMEGYRQRTDPSSAPRTREDAMDAVDGCGGYLQMIRTHGISIGKAMQAGLGIDRPILADVPRAGGRRTGKRSSKSA